MRLGIAAVIGLLALPAAADAKRGECAVRGSTTDARDRQTRVYHVDRSGVSHYFACSRRSGKRTRIGADDLQELYVEKLRSPFLLYTWSDSPGGSTITSTLHRLDLRTGRKRTVTGFSSFGGHGTVLEDLALTRRGVVVWIERRYEETTFTRVKMFDGRRVTILDPGPEVDTGSLAVTPSGRRAYWTNAGEPRSAELLRRASAGAARRRGACAARRSTTVAANEVARLYYVERDRYDVRTDYACLRRTGRRWRIPPRGSVYDEVRQARLAGHYVGYVAESVASQGRVGYLVRLDLRTGARERVAKTDESYYSGNAIRCYVLARTGAVAWSKVDYRIEPPDNTYTVENVVVDRMDAGGRDRLDSDRSIKACSLELRHRPLRVLWTRSGEPRSARLR